MSVLVLFGDLQFPNRILISMPIMKHKILFGKCYYIIPFVRCTHLQVHLHCASCLIRTIPQFLHFERHQHYEICHQSMQSVNVERLQNKATFFKYLILIQTNLY